MTIEEVYSNICGDYQGVIGRLMSEDRVKRFALKFLNDTSCNTLIDAIEREDAEEAFRAAHTLKGICINLGFDDLYRICSEITELLREKQDADCDFDECTRLLIQAKEKYDIVIDSIKRLDD